MGTPQLVSSSGASLAPAVIPPKKLNPLTFIRDAGGIPQPPSDILAALKRWEPALGLRYVNVQWALTWEWKEHDPRRQWIKDGKYNANDAYDIVGYVPLDCPLEEVPAYAVKALRQYPREEVRKLADTVGNYNVHDVGKQQVADVLNATLDSPDFNASVTKNSAAVSVVSDIGKPRRFFGRRDR